MCSVGTVINHDNKKTTGITADKTKFMKGGTNLDGL